MFIKFLGFIFLLSYTIAASADDCAVPQFNMSSLFNLYKTSCSNQGPLTICECLKQESKDNPFLEGLFKDNADLEVSKEEFRKQQTNRLFSMYTQMTYGHAYQKQILGIDLKPIVGCSADDLSKFFKDAVTNQLESNHKNDEANLNKKLAGCTGDCSKIRAELKEIEKKIKNVDKEADKTCSELSGIIGQNLNESAAKKGLIAKLNQAKSWYKTQPSGKDKIAEIDKLIEEIMTAKASTPSLTNSSLTRDDSCTRDDVVGSTYKMLIGSYEEDLKNKNAKLAKAIKDDAAEKARTLAVEAQRKEKEKNDVISETTNGLTKLTDRINSFNNEVTAELEKSYDTVPENGCYTYSEFQLYKSMPSEALMAALRDTPEGNQSNFFVPKTDISDKLEVEKLNFLRANPIFANMQPVECAGHDLPQIMRKFANSTKGMSTADRMKAYVDLMKSKDVTDLLNAQEVQAGAAGNCETLGKNLAAVYTTDEPGPIPEFNTSNALNMLKGQILTCKIKDSQKQAKDNITFTLRSNPLYLISTSSDVDPTVASRNQEYQNFLKANCGGFEAKRKSYIAEACKSRSDKEACEKEFDDTNKSASIREKYWNGVKDAKRALNQVLAQATKPLFPADHSSVQTVNEPSAQDQRIRRLYHNEIRPKLSTTVLASNGNEKAYTQELVKNSQTIAAVASAAATTNQTVTPAIAEPDWTKPSLPEVTPQTLASGKTSNFLPPNYPDLPPSEKMETLKSAKEKVALEGAKLQQQAKTTQEKDKSTNDLRKSIANIDSEAEKVKKLANLAPLNDQSIKNASDSTPAANTNSNTGSSQNNSGSGRFNTVSNPQNFASAKVSNTAAPDRTSATLLKTKYLGSDTRSPASVKTEELHLVVGPPVSKEVDSGAKLMAQLPLQSSSFGDKELILSKVKEQISKNKLKSGEEILIQFFDKAKNEVLIVSVSQINDQWIISPVPRKALLSNLSLTIIEETKQ